MFVVFGSASFPAGSDNVFLSGSPFAENRSLPCWITVDSPGQGSVVLTGKAVVAFMRSMANFEVTLRGAVASVRR